MYRSDMEWKLAHAASNVIKSQLAEGRTPQQAWSYVQDLISTHLNDQLDKASDEVLKLSKITKFFDLFRKREGA